MKINELHDKLYELLTLVDDICKKENVRYFLAFGTELGSVREKDFIPWDDDMDLQILSEDFDKFKDAMNKNLPPYMKFIEPRDFGNGFFDLIFRIVDTRYTIKQPTDEDIFYQNYQNYLGTDVFVLTKVPKNEFRKKIFILKNKILYGLCMGHRYKLNYEKYGVTDKIKVGLLANLGKKINLHFLLKVWYKNILKYNCLEYDRFTPCSPVRSMKILNPNIYIDKTCGEIRNRKFPIPIGFDEELKFFYGNYLKKPDDFYYYIQHLDKEEVEQLKRIYDEAD